MRLCDVLPCISAKGLVHDRIADPMLVGECRDARGVGHHPRFPHYFLRQFVASVAFALHPSVPSLTPHVALVVGVGAEEQMIGANTERRIAVVANQHPVGNGSEGKLPRESMRGNMLAVPLYRAVSTVIRVSCPEPAAVTLLNTRPEALLNTRMTTLETAELLKLASCLDRKLHSALLANKPPHWSAGSRIRHRANLRTNECAIQRDQLWL